MPKVSRNQTVPKKKASRRPAVIVDEVTGEEVRVSSVVFGFVMLVAIVVATAAWMGGSMSQIENRFASFMDNTARTVGISVNDVSVIGLEQDPALAQDIRAAAMIEPCGMTARHGLLSTVLAASFRVPAPMTTRN